MSSSLVSVRNLSVEYHHDGKRLVAVRDANLTLEKGKTLGIVGESGSGKSTLALALIGLLPPQESRVSADILQFDGQSLIDASAEEWRRLRGRRIAMVFQDPFAALNPVLTIEYQLQETISLEGGKPDALRAIELLNQVQLTEPERILNSYPHQLSGGQRQRVLIAIALARKPDFLIADEPTTALDVTVQDEIVKLLKKLQTEMNMAMMYVTHNLGLVKGLSDQLGVMCAGQIVEYGETRQILSHPQHPYTEGLLRCIPSLKKSDGPIPTLENRVLYPEHPS